MGMNIILVMLENDNTINPLVLDAHKEDWISLILNKENASLTVRKRWLKIENYSDPVRDLVGASITARQDQVSIYKDATCVLSEKALS